MFELTFNYLEYICFGSNMTLNDILSEVSNYISLIMLKKNAIKYLKLFDKHNLNIDYNIYDYIYNKPIAVCLRYGQCNTLKYLLTKNVINEKNQYLYYSLNNYNYKITEILLNYLKK